MKRCMQLMYLLLAVGAMLSGGACNRSEPPQQVSLKPAETAKVADPGPKLQPLRIGMGAMITPKEGYVYYQRLQKYIEKNLGRPVQLVDRESYTEMNALLEAGEVDAAFVCAGPYVDGKARFNLELLAMPLVKGKPIYYSYILVHKDSPIKSFTELRGKVFAFTDPKSNSGAVVPTYMLAKMKESPERYFSRVEYTFGHDKSIRAVAEKIVDGAAVDSLIWEYLAMKNPEITGQTKIIATSEPYGIPPMVVRHGIDQTVKQKLKEILVSAADDPEGKEILKGMMIDSFVAGDDKNYDSIRDMKVWIAGQRKAK